MLCGTDEKEMMCDEASTVGDHKDSHKVGGFNPLVINKTHFCRMFYHVSETRHAGCKPFTEVKKGNFDIRVHQ